MRRCTSGTYASFVLFDYLVLSNMYSRAGPAASHLHKCYARLSSMNALIFPTLSAKPFKEDHVLESGAESTICKTITMQAFFSRASGSVPYYHDMQTFATILSRHVRSVSLTSISSTFSAVSQLCHPLPPPILSLCYCSFAPNSKAFILRSLLPFPSLYTLLL